MLQQKYKKIYQDIKPDVVLMEETKERMKAEALHPRKSQKLIIVFASVAAVAVLTVAAAISAPLLFHNDHLLTHSSENASSSTESGEVSSTNDTVTLDQYVPDWYEPGEFTVLALQNNKNMTVEGMSYTPKSGPTVAPLGAPLSVRNSLMPTAPILMSNNSQTESKTESPDIAQSKLNSIMIDVPDGLVAAEMSSENYIKLVWTDSNSPYYQKNNIYYDLIKKKVICLDGVDEEVANQSGLITSNLVYDGSIASPIYNTSILKFQNRKTGHYRYFVRYPDNRLEELKVKDDDAISLRLSSDQRYAMIVIDGNVGSNIDIYVADLAQEKITTRNISVLNGQKYRANEFQIAFSDNGDYVQYQLRGTANNSEKSAKWIIYHLESNNWFQITGKIIRYIDDEKAILTETKSGAKIIDTATGKDITATTKLQAWEEREVLVLPYDTGYTQSKNNIYSQSIVTRAGTAELLAEGANAYLIHEKYVYALFADDWVVTCYSLENGESFTVKLPDGLRKQVEKTATQERPAFYTLNLNIDLTKLVVRFSVPDNAMGYVMPKETYGQLFPQYFWVANSLEDMREWVGKTAKDYVSGYTESFTWNTRDEFPFVKLSDCVNQDAFKIFYGDGFTCLRFMTKGQLPYLYIAVEDYRNQTFTLYEYDGFTNLNDISIYQNYRYVQYPSTDQFRKKLAEGASQEKTRELFNFLPSDTAPIDYAEYYTNGKLDNEKLRDYKISLIFTDVIDVKIRTHNLRTPIYKEQTEYEWNAPEEWTEVVDFLKKQKYNNNVSSPYEYANSRGYLVVLKTKYTEVLTYIGRLQNSNKPYIFVENAYSDSHESHQSYCAFPAEEEYQKIEAYLTEVAERILPPDQD